MLFQCSSIYTRMENKPEEKEKQKLTGPFLSFALIVVSVIYGFSQRANTSAPAPIQGVPSPVTQTNPVAQVKPPADSVTPASAVPTPTAVPPTPAKATGTYKDGTYVGAATDAYYGTVQVQAVIRNGKIADVPFLQYPNSRGHSRAVNGQAMPILTSEAIAAQSAQVDVVSGATFTSEAFMQSLRSALTQAKV